VRGSQAHNHVKHRECMQPRPCDGHSVLLSRPCDGHSVLLSRHQTNGLCGRPPSLRCCTVAFTKRNPQACRYDQRRHKENMSGCYATGAVCLCMRAPLPCSARNAFAIQLQLERAVVVGVTQGTVRASQHLVAPSRSDLVEFCSCIAHPQFLDSGHRGCQRHRAVLSVG
jgi:hypothetical protein